MKNLDECEGYIIALKDVQAMISGDVNNIPALKEKLNEMIEGCEYALGECASGMMADAYPHLYGDVA